MSRENKMTFCLKCNKAEKLFINLSLVCHKVTVVEHSVKLNFLHEQTGHMTIIDIWKNCLKISMADNILNWLHRYTFVNDQKTNQKETERRHVKMSGDM